MNEKQINGRTANAIVDAFVIVIRPLFSEVLENRKIMIIHNQQNTKQMIFHYLCMQLLIVF